VSAWATAYGDTLASATAAIKASFDVLIIILPVVTSCCALATTYQGFLRRKNYNKFSLFNALTDFLLSDLLRNIAWQLNRNDLSAIRPQLAKPRCITSA
jgi:hypothetical protein